ncbi:Vgb family protein [Enhygromyxa salina]|uniref:Methionine ABC transporter ATP-binding protein n=1 Tax=Enhygromyxa salina TaxID=215803 RepID=A0A2S9YT43_9BACT|nr:hypothetical protein [Enhygromyxa salina]PRQ08285.1 hypothetical protein ENSA7_19080 [Enhygromyxa salina]
MKTAAIVCVMGLGVALGGCGGNTGAESKSGVGDETGNSDSNSNSNSNSAEGAETNGDDDPGDGDPGDGDGDPGDGDGDPGEGDAEGGSNQKFDTLTVPDAAFNCGSGGNEDPEFSFLWAANSQQGTISKIDTKTVTEIGRYIVRPDSNGSPSRTSVSLSGHVAVANRDGGVTKIYADEQFCEESNGVPGIQTSNSNQFLPWGTEECIAWYKPMQYQSQRPVAWGPGEFNEGSCQWENEELWTAATNGGTIDVYVLDGDDGSTKEMITLQGIAPEYFGIYGAAVDGNGDFWGSQLGWGKLVRVNRSDMTYDIWQSPQNGSWYGMTVDSEGYVWLCSDHVGRFDPATETWQTAAVGGYTGCMADAAEDGLLWMSDGQGVIGVNRDTLQVEKQWNAAGSYGVSIDFEGYVWTVAYGSNVSKIDPVTGQFWTYNGLVGAYTYSDMTGYALSNVGSPSG